MASHTYAALATSPPRHSHRQSLRTLNSPPIIPPLPRFTLPYILQSSAEIRTHILSYLEHSPNDLKNFRKVSTLFCIISSQYLFKEIWVRFTPNYWKERPLIELSRIGKYARRVVFVFKNVQLDGSGTHEEDTRISYKAGQDFELEMPEHGGKTLVWTTSEHLNPIPEIMEFRIAGEVDARRDDYWGAQATDPTTTTTTTTTSDAQSQEPHVPKSRFDKRVDHVSIPIQKTGGDPVFKKYGPLLLSCCTIDAFAILFESTPNVSSLTIQTSGDDTFWEYTSVDVALEAIRIGAVAAGVRLEELVCAPIHILGVDSLSPVGIRFDITPDTYDLLGWGGLKKLDLAVDTRVLMAPQHGQEGTGRDRAIYGRIVRTFFLGLTQPGRSSLEVLNFQWIGGEYEPCKEALDCPFIVSTDDNNAAEASLLLQASETSVEPQPLVDEYEAATICDILKFPHLKKLSITNVAVTPEAFEKFLERAPKCANITFEFVVFRGGGTVASFKQFQLDWEQLDDYGVDGDESFRISGHYVKPKPRKFY
ncbi:hypothetical protein DFH27DRAFT_607416 [Peziza echinospora]|nr:hypothetical protein DFH27DRAFT_607416 [Peziza echinospora]